MSRTASPSPVATDFDALRLRCAEHLRELGALLQDPASLIDDDAKMARFDELFGPAMKDLRALTPMIEERQRAKSQLGQPLC